MRNPETRMSPVPAATGRGTNTKLTKHIRNGSGYTEPTSITETVASERPTDVPIVGAVTITVKPSNDFGRPATVAGWSHPGLAAVIELGDTTIYDLVGVMHHIAQAIQDANRITVRGNNGDAIDKVIRNLNTGAGW